MSKVVIFMGDGILQGILADSWLTDVLGLDRDIEGVIRGDPGLKEFDREIFYVGQGGGPSRPELCGSNLSGSG